MRGQAKFLVVSWDGGGNALSALNLSALLVRHGRVRLLGWESMASRAGAVGAEFAAYPSVPPWPVGLTLEDAWGERLRPALHGQGTRDDICAEAERFGPDVVVVDCMMGAGLEAADRLGLPYTVLVHVPYTPFMHEWSNETRRTARNYLLANASAVQILTPPGFDTPCRLPTNTAFVGPIMAPRPRELRPCDIDLLNEPGHPWVLLSLSTTEQGQADALPRIFKALAPLPVRVLLTAGGTLPTNAINTPANVTVRGFVPHQLLLPHMAAVVSHGGLGTITTSLAFGLPLVCIPQGRDQYHNSARVAACHVGRSLARDAPPADITAAIDEVLADQVLRREAGRFAAVIDRLGRGEAAARNIAALADSAAPAPSAGSSHDGLYPHRS